MNRSSLVMLAVLIMTLLLAALLYCMEFSVGTTDEELEKAIEEYTDMDVEILEQQGYRKRMFVLYVQQNHEGWGGLAELERGPFEGYRILNCKNFDGQLYHAVQVSWGNQTHILVYGLHELPGVRRYEVYCGENFITVGDPRFEPAPILRSFAVSESVFAYAPEIRYYDAENVEIPADALKAQIPLADGGNGGATYTAELGMIYVFMALIMACGIVIIGSFALRKRSGEA